MKSITHRHGEKHSRTCDEPEIVIAKVTGDRFPWLAGQSGNVSGSIERGLTKRSWGYVLLGRNERGESEIWELGGGFRNWREAEQRLMLAIEATEQD
jgi:hypothetical protein